MCWLRSKKGRAGTRLFTKHGRWWTSVKGKEWRISIGTVSTYIDSDGLKWEHRFERPPHEDELIGFGSNGEEVLIITLESFYPTTAPSMSGAIISPLS